MNSQYTKNISIQQEEDDLRASDPDLVQESLEEFVVKESQKESRGETKFDDSISKTFEPSDSDSFVPLRIWSGHKPSKGTIAFMKDITIEDLQKMTDLFYEKAFQDYTLDKFIRSHEDPHAARFAKWIHQKLSGSTLWDQDRAERHKRQELVTLANGQTNFLVHDRTSAHVAAWYSTKRPRHEVGRHFKLDECRTWMRLHFWAMRESGMMEKSPAFCDYYVRFIGHFVSKYESTAPRFARESFRWSASQENIQLYLRNRRIMMDVMGFDYQTALSQLPISEANDSVWPYNATANTANQDGEAW